MCVREGSSMKNCWGVMNAGRTAICSPGKISANVDIRDIRFSFRERLWRTEFRRKGDRVPSSSSPSPFITQK